MSEAEGPGPSTQSIASALALELVRQLGYEGELLRSSVGVGVLVIAIDSANRFIYCDKLAEIVKELYS